MTTPTEAQLQQARDIFWNWADSQRDLAGWFSDKPIIGAIAAALAAEATAAAEREREACAQLVNDAPSIMDGDGRPITEDGCTIVARLPVVTAIRARR